MRAHDVIDDKKFYLDVLKGDECWCQKYKRPRAAVCWSCWKRLPKDLQRDLYRRMGAGFEEAYDAAVAWLSD